MRALVAAFLAIVLAAPADAQGERPGAHDPRSLAEAAHDASLRHYLQAVVAEHAGDVAGAIDELRLAFSYEPSAADLAVHLAALSLQTGDARGALEYARRGIVLGDSTGRARLISGSALASFGRVAEARTEFDRAVEVDPTSVEAWLALGRACEETGDIEGAARALRRAYGLDGDQVETVWRLAGIEARLGHLDAADSLLDQVAAVAPDLPGVAVTRGWIADREGRSADAARAYAEHLEQFPGDTRVRRQLLQSYVRLDDHARALEQARLLAAESPDDLDVARLLVALHLRAGRLDEARKVARALRAATPGRVDAGAFAISVLGFTGKEADARREADALTREAPRNYRAWLVAAETWAARESKGRRDPEVDRRYAAGEAVQPDSVSARIATSRSLTRTQRFEAAERQLKGALDRTPDDADLWLELAFARERRTDLVGAEVAARRSLELVPRNAPALNFLGYLFADANIKLDEAEPLIRQALQIEPENPYYIDSLGWALFRQGRLEDARTTLERALSISGGDPEIHAHLGDVFLALGRNDDAKAQYHKGLQLDPTSDDLTRKLESLR